MHGIIAEVDGKTIASEDSGGELQVGFVVKLLLLGGLNGIDQDGAFHERALRKSKYASRERQNDPSGVSPMLSACQACIDSQNGDKVRERRRFCLMGASMRAG